MLCPLTNSYLEASPDSRIVFEVRNTHDVEGQLELPAKLSGFEPVAEIVRTAVGLADIGVEGRDEVEVLFGFFDGDVVHLNEISAVGEAAEEAAVMGDGIVWSRRVGFPVQEVKEVQIAFIFATGPAVIVHPVPIFALATFFLLELGFLVDHGTNLTDPHKNTEPLGLSEAVSELSGSCLAEDLKCVVKLLSESLDRFDGVQTLWMWMLGIVVSCCTDCLSGGVKNVEALDLVESLRWCLIGIVSGLFTSLNRLKGIL